MCRSDAKLWPSFVLDVRDNRERVKRWRKNRQAQAVHQEKCCLQHFHSEKRDVTEIEIQRGERRGESFPAWVNVKSHIVEIIIWRKSQSDLQCGCCGLGSSLSQVSLKFAGLDINSRMVATQSLDSWSRRCNSAQHKPSLQIQLRAEGLGKKRCGDTICALNYSIQKQFGLLNLFSL